MFCKSCGNEIDEDSSFCSYCGVRQSSMLKPLNKNQNLGPQDSKAINVNLSFGKPVFIEEKIENEKREKYDSSYKRATEATIFGFGLFICSIIFLIAGGIKESNGNSRLMFAVVSLLVRIIACFWVVDLAKSQNRNKDTWGIFAFVFPTIALIIIGLLRKINVEVDKTNQTSQSEEVGSTHEVDQDKFNETDNNQEGEVTSEIVTVVGYAIVMLMIMVVAIAVIAYHNNK